MAENNHTPGPWQGCLHLRSDADEKCGCGYVGGIWSVSSDLMICEMGPSGQGSDLIPVPSRDEVKANARLIAAAPDVLEALKLFVHEYVELVESGDAGFWDAEKEGKVIKARAAIAKAEGSS